MDKNVTTLVDFQNPDDECLPITECVCGKKFQAWTEILSIYKDDPWECPNCKAKLYFHLGVKVFQVE